MNRVKETLSAYWSWMSSRTVYAITLAFNWRGGVGVKSGSRAVKSFGAKLDAYRLGSRFYRKPIGDRTQFVLLPEKWGAYPHYHGLFQVPDDARARRQPSDYPALIGATWKSIVPAGTADVRDIYDADGWLDYISKETAMNDDAVVQSLDHWAAQPDR